MASKTKTLVRLQTWNLTALGEGMKILYIKDHVGYYPQFRGRPFELKKKMMNYPGFYKFPRFTIFYVH